MCQETTARGTRAAETIAAAPAKNSKLSTTRSPVRTGLQAEGVHTMYTNTSGKEIAPSGHTFPCSLFVCCLCDIFKSGLLGKRNGYRSRGLNWSISEIFCRETVIYYDFAIVNELFPEYNFSQTFPFLLRFRQ